MFDPQERRYLESAPLGRLATADSRGYPHVVPICFALVDDHLVTAIDEKPQRVDAADLRRSRDVRENPHVAVVVDHYADDWSQLGWVQVRGTATHETPDSKHHDTGVAALREKYDQYASHDLDERPLIHITPEASRSWGRLTRSER